MQMNAKYKLDNTQRVITIFSFWKRLIDGFIVTNLRVVADHKIVEKIVIFLNFLTLKGCTNFIGIKVKTKKKIMIDKFNHSLVFKI